jgi:proteasome accessory factor C
MPSRFEHLLILVPWLANHPGVTVSEAAGHFNRTEAQLVEDLTLLTLTGVGQFAMEQFEITWNDGHIYVRDHLGLDRPFTFDAMEAACLLLGLDLLSMVAEEGTDIDPAVVESVRKKIKSLPLEKVIHVLEDKFQSLVMDEIGKAIHSGVQIEITYWNSGRDETSIRCVSPRLVRSSGDVPVVDAFDHTSQGWRTFRLDRMTHAQVTSKPAELPSSDFEPMPVRLAEFELKGSRRDVLDALDVASAEDLNGLIRGTLRVHSTQWLARQVQHGAGALVIVGPDEVVAEVKSHVLSALAAYETH